MVSLRFTQIFAPLRYAKTSYSRGTLYEIIAMGNTQPSSEIKSIEEKLLTNPYRSDKAFLDKYLDDTFLELRTTGQLVDKNQTIADLVENKSDIIYKLSNFSSRQISDTQIQVFYEIEKKGQTDVIIQKRTSIWKISEEGWKMIYNQGTLVKQSPR